VKNGNLVRSLSEAFSKFQRNVSSLAVSPDGSRLVAGCWDGIVRVTNFALVSLIHIRFGSDHQVTKLK
jgi:WD40 repeat protein